MTLLFPVTCSSTTLQQWDDFSRFNKNRAEAEMKSATELREAIALTITEVGEPPQAAAPQPTDGTSVPSAYFPLSIDHMVPLPLT